MARWISVVGIALMVSGCVVPVTPTSKATPGDDATLKTGVGGQTLKAGAGGTPVIGLGAGGKATTPPATSGTSGLVSTGAAQGLASGTTKGDNPVVGPAGLGSGIIAAGGGNIIAAGGGNIIAAGGGNLVMSGDMAIVTADKPTMPGGGGALTEVENGEPRPQEATRGTARVLLPAAWVADAKAPVPVEGATVWLCSVGGEPLDQLTTDAAGEATFESMTTNTLYALRAQFSLGGQTYYFSAPAMLSQEGAIVLDPLSTMLEAKFFLVAKGQKDPEALMSQDRYTALRQAIEGLNLSFEPAIAKVETTFATRAALYDQAAQAHPAAFAAGIETWTPVTGELAVSL